MEDSELAVTKTKRKQELERLSLEEAMRLQKKFDEEERQRIAILHEEAGSFNIEEWDDIQAQIQADEEMTQKLLEEEKESISIEERSRLLTDIINDRKRYFATQRAEEKRNKPPTQAQQRSYMCNYIKNIGSHTLQQLRGYTFDEIKILFKTTIRSVNTFVPMETEVGSSQARGSKRAAKEELDQQISKKQKTNELDDLLKLWSLVSERFNSTKPTDDKEREIWVELKWLFEPDSDDEL
ncbi:hypothetical protein Tco_0145193 [Tanacetum coccineum]